MNLPDLIVKKRDGGILDPADIDYVVQGFTRGDIPDYQMSALLMAMCCRGLNAEETLALTASMAHSGAMLHLSSEFPFVGDKHSTGGVGDKVSLVALPVAAACGLPIAKMSGRGLAFTGGTIDKLESIPGFRSCLSIDEFKSNLKQVGLVIASQSAQMAPADGKIYALRDVTGTVDSTPLIAASVMSKKIALGASTLVLDVKTGDGTFIRAEDEASALARLMVAIARDSGIKCNAIVSDMNQPLGAAVGNALELREALEALGGNGPQDLLDLSIAVAGLLLTLSGLASSTPEAQDKCRSVLTSGAALGVFAHFVEAQAGDARYVENPALLPSAAYQVPVVATDDGYVVGLSARQIGRAALALGAGRIVRNQAVDHSAGVTLHRKVGDMVASGEVVAIVHGNRREICKRAATMVRKAYRFGSERQTRPPLIHTVIE